MSFDPTSLNLGSLSMVLRTLFALETWAEGVTADAAQTQSTKHKVLSSFYLLGEL
jgi:hypothetical protein